MPVTGRIESVNVGKGMLVRYDGETFATGFQKSPAEGIVATERIMLRGDTQSSMYLHKGNNAKAVYAYAIEDYDWFASQYGIVPQPGLFGENLTLRGVDLGGSIIGDCWRAGSIVLEVSEPRLPCYKLGWRMGDRQWVGIFARALRPGAFFRIVEDGSVRCGDTFALERRPKHGVTVAEVMRIRLYAPEERNRLRDVDALPFNYRAWISGEPDILNGD